MKNRLCKQPTELLQIVNFTIVNKATNLSISSSCTSLLKSGLLQLVICKLVNYNLLKQLVASVWIKSFDHQLATNLLTTLNRLVVNKLSQGIRTHPDIGLLLMKPVARCQQTCCNLCVFGCAGNILGRVVRKVDSAIQWIVIF